MADDSKGLEDDFDAIVYTIVDEEGAKHEVTEECIVRSRVLARVLTDGDDEDIPFPWSTKDTLILIEYMKNLVSSNTPRREYSIPLSKEDWMNFHAYDYALLESIKKERGLEGVRAFFIGPANWIDIPELFESTTVYMMANMRDKDEKTIRADFNIAEN